jgi:23S rRNA-/tRNA-specific pseudouridylate synthase
MKDPAIVLETANLLVVDKPAGEVVIPDRHGSDSLHGRLERERGEKLWVVHRLDREVSGLLVFARNAAAHRALSMAFEGRTVEKRYFALSEGEAPLFASYRWEDRLLRGKKRSYPSPHGKPAITEAEVVDHVSGALAWRLKPLTGRNHQLRVHLARAGFPILGDGLYGSAREWSPGIALRAVRLALPAFDGEPAHDLELADLRAS